MGNRTSDILRMILDKQAENKINNLKMELSNLRESNCKLEVDSLKSNKELLDQEVKYQQLKTEKERVDSQLLNQIIICGQLEAKNTKLEQSINGIEDKDRLIEDLRFQIEETKKKHEKIMSNQAKRRQGHEDIFLPPKKLGGKK